MTDPEAVQRFQELYAHNYRRVYAYAVSKAGRQLADEVVSEVFLVAWRRLADVPAHALPWLLAVARNVATGQFRTAARQQSVAAEMRAWVREEQISPDVADEVSERISVLTALAALPEQDRELLTLVAWHGLSARDAAQMMGCSTAAFFVRLHRARRRLDRALADSPGTGPAGPTGAAGTAGPACRPRDGSAVALSAAAAGPDPPCLAPAAESQYPVLTQQELSGSRYRALAHRKERSL